MTSQTEILALFDEFGNELTVSRRALLKLEAQNRSIRFTRKVLGNKSGTFWLVSARPGHVRMVLEIVLHKGHGTGEWSMGWGVNGIASYPHWDLESTLQRFLDREPAPHCAEDASRACRDTRLPANVEKLAREHVYFVPDVKGTREDDQVRPRFALRIVSADEAKTGLAKITNADTSKLIADHAGRRVEILPLMLAVELFCSENADAAGKQLDMLMALTKQHIKLFYLMWRLGRQVASE